MKSYVDHTGLAGMIQDIFSQTVKKYSGKNAVTDGEIRLTYDELFMLKERVKEYFIHKLHIRQTNRIALFLPNCSDFICAFFAAADIGAVTIPLNIHLKERELQYYIDKCGIKTVITHSNLLSQWGEIPLQMKGVKFVSSDRLIFRDKNMRTAENAYRVSKTHSLESAVLYLCTSGSTGRPKIIPKTHALLTAGAENLGNALAITSQDRFLGVAPFFHANGFENCMLLPMLRGASVVIMRQFSPRNMLELLSKEKITVLNASPFIFSSLIDVADKSYDLSSIRLCLSTGAPLPSAIKKNFLEKFGITIREHYGSSETGPISAQLEACDDAIGRPFGKVKVKIVDDDGKELPPDSAGEVLIHSNSMMKGYLDEPELTKEAFLEGFFRTGDLGRFDLAGNISIIGRKKMIINASGIKIDPIEIQNVLLSFHKVKKAFVTGVKNRMGMEMVKAIVVAQPTCTIKEIIMFCRERLADYKIPRIIEFRDKIPTDVMGKVIWSQIEE
jgi:long-chain acyl-CoA synthetase